MATVKGIWVFKEVISLPPMSAPPLTEGQVKVFQNVNFTSYDTEYTYIGVGTTNGTSWQLLTYDHNMAYMAGWDTTAVSRIIDFGETEQTVNDAFLTWLEDNAVQTPTADLTNTTWNIPAGWTAEAGYGFFNIECGITLPDWSDTMYGVVGVAAIGYAPNNKCTEYVSTANSIAWGETAMPHNGVTNTSTVTLEDIGGTDVTNPSLIWWLSTNGEMEVKVTIPAGTYVASDKPALTDLAYAKTVTTDLGYTSNGNSYTQLTVAWISGMDFDGYELRYGSLVVYGAQPAASVNGWTNEAYKTIVIETDQTVSADFATWFNMNYTLQATEPEETTPTVTLTYNGKTYTLTAGQKATFACEGKVMLDDITASVVSGESEDIIIDGPTIDTGEIPSAGGSEVTLISFTVGSTTYQAEEGMKWYEWCDSEYNTDGYYIDGNFVRPIAGIVVTNANANFVSPSSTIINGYAYDRMGAGGAD